jgi:hypothetical protein
MKVKSQITNTKLQINLKLQNSMTQTFSAVVSIGFANPDLLKIMPLGISGNGLLIWNFEFSILVVNSLHLVQKYPLIKRRSAATP